MNVKFRQLLERRVALWTINSAIAAGCTVSVNDGEDEVLTNSTDRKAILAAMFTTDEDYLLILRDGEQIGWVFFVYGNSGWDVVNDYSTTIESIMAPVNDRADKLGDKWG